MSRWAAEISDISGEDRPQMFLNSGGHNETSLASIKDEDGKLASVLNSRSETQRLDLRPHWNLGEKYLAFAIIFSIFLLHYFVVVKFEI